jgi:hypothetical protein
LGRHIVMCVQALRSPEQVEKAHSYAEHFDRKTLDKLALGSLLADLRNSTGEEYIKSTI